MQEACLQVHLGSDEEHNCEQDQVLDHPELTTPSPKRLPQLANVKVRQCLRSSVHFMC